MYIEKWQRHLLQDFPKIRKRVSARSGYFPKYRTLVSAWSGCFFSLRKAIFWEVATSCFSKSYSFATFAFVYFEKLLLSYFFARFTFLSPIATFGVFQGGCPKVVCRCFPARWSESCLSVFFFCRYLGVGWVLPIVSFPGASG